MTVALLNRIGLACGITGVVLLFIWGPPQPSFEEGIGIALEDGTLLPDGRTAAQHDRDTLLLKARHTVMSRMGLVLVGIGFAAQFAATFCDA